MAGTNPSAPTSSTQEQLYLPPGPQLPIDLSRQNALSPPDPQPPSYSFNQEIVGPYLLEPGAGNVYVEGKGYPIGPRAEGSEGSPIQAMIYQPQPTLQPPFVMEARGPELPVSPHPAIALGEHSIFHSYTL